MSTDAAVAQVLATFRAASPRYQTHCINVINNTRPRWEPAKGAQFEQDMYVWRNLFARQSARGERCFYIESGANAPHAGSNTWFFDRCLGWEGLCIEPNPTYIIALQRGRSCTVVNECISNVRGVKLRFALHGVGSHVVSDEEADPTNSTRTVMVECNPLDAILDKYAAGRRRVDFWSLDVEGLERKVRHCI